MHPFTSSKALSVGISSDVWTYTHGCVWVNWAKCIQGRFTVIAAYLCRHTSNIERHKSLWLQSAAGTYDLCRHSKYGAYTLHQVKGMCTELNKQEGA